MNARRDRLGLVLATTTGAILTLGVIIIALGLLGHPL